MSWGPASQDEDLFVTGYDCSNAAFNQNLTLPRLFFGFQDSNETAETGFSSEEAEIQLLQMVAAETVRVTEVKVSKLETIQQCGEENYSWSWWHEIMAAFNTETLQLTALELLNIVNNKRITLGSEYPDYHGTVVPLDDGITKKRITPVGAITHNPTKSGRPYCQGEKYRDQHSKIHPKAVVITEYTVIKKTMTSTMSASGQVQVGGLDDCYLSGTSSACYDVYSGILFS